MINLSKKNKEVFNKIVKSDKDKKIFEFGVYIGRTQLAKEQLDILTK